MVPGLKASAGHPSPSLHCWVQKWGIKELLKYIGSILKGSKGPHVVSPAITCNEKQTLSACIRSRSSTKAALHHLYTVTQMHSTPPPCHLMGLHGPMELAQLTPLESGRAQHESIHRLPVLETCGVSSQHGGHTCIRTGFRRQNHLGPVDDYPQVTCVHPRMPKPPPMAPTLSPGSDAPTSSTIPARLRTIPHRCIVCICSEQPCQ